MGMTRVFGVVVLAGGAVLFGFAYHSANAPVEKIAVAMTGRYSNATTLYFAVGIAATVGGALLALFGNRK